MKNCPTPEPELIDEMNMYHIGYTHRNDVRKVVARQHQAELVRVVERVLDLDVQRVLQHLHDVLIKETVAEYERRSD